MDLFKDANDKGRNKYFNNQNSSGNKNSFLNDNLSELDTLLQDLSNGCNQSLNNKQYTSESKVKIMTQEQSEDFENLCQSLQFPPTTSYEHQAQHYNLSQESPIPQEAKSSFYSSVSNRHQTASNATEELDDLMSKLSDIQINQRQNLDFVDTNQDVQITERKLFKNQNQYFERNVHTTTSSSSSQPIPQNNKQNLLDSMLGNLQVDMSRHGITITQKGCCSACEKPIVGQVITALGRTWHPEHFTCTQCDQELGTKNFFEREGRPYCEPDYHNLFSPRCAYCNGPILDKCVTALDKTWHTEHFFCAQCGKQFGEEGFHEKDGKPYCREDYFEMFAPKCGGCNRAIMENYISALNNQWHPNCFVCRDCFQKFQGGSFYDYEGLPYCEMHYHAKRGSLCAGCHKPITGRCITAMFKKFHPEHFVCAFCLKQLNKGTFKEQNDKPYCHGCFEKLFG